MSRHGQLFGLLVAGVAVLQLVAADTRQWSISPLYCGSSIVFLTRVGNAIQCQPYTKPVAQQLFRASDPSLINVTLVSVADPTYALDYSYDVKAKVFSVLMRPGNGGKQQLWTVDTWGRLCTADMKNMASVTVSGSSVATKGSVFSIIKYTAPPVDTATQFVFRPDKAASSTLKIYDLTPGSAKQMCVDSAVALYIGDANTPIMAPCDGSKMSQNFEVLPPLMDGTVTDSFPGIFRIRSKTTGLCLSQSMAMGSRSKLKFYYNILQVACDTTYSETSWTWNLRGQLQTARKIVTAAASEDQVAVTAVMCMVISSGTGLLRSEVCSDDTGKWLVQ